MSLFDAHGVQRVALAIGTPCQDSVSAGYAHDLARLVGCIAATRPDITITVLQSRGTIIPAQRASLVKAAQQHGATHLLWLDADMRFPEDTFFRLLSHGEPIVACNYATRRHPIIPTAEVRGEGHLMTLADDLSLVEVSHCGMGVMLVDMAVYAQLPAPWFALGYSPKDDNYAGEDVFFCRKARDAGFPVLVDQATSQLVRHAGEMEWTHAHTHVTRDAMEAA